MTIFLQVWAALGPLIGISVGAYFTRAWQRKQWTLESKKTEYRELLSTLSRSVRCILNNSPGLWGGGPYVVTGEQEKNVMEADTEARSTIEDRVFIHNAIENEKVLEHWQLLVAEKEIIRFLEYWRSLHKILIDIAQKDLGIKN